MDKTHELMVMRYAGKLRFTKRRPKCLREWEDDKPINMPANTRLEIKFSVGSRNEPRTVEVVVERDDEEFMPTMLLYDEHLVTLEQFFDELQLMEADIFNVELTHAIVL